MSVMSSEFVHSIAYGDVDRLSVSLESLTYGGRDRVMRRNVFTRCVDFSIDRHRVVSAGFRPVRSTPEKGIADLYFVKTHVCLVLCQLSLVLWGRRHAVVISDCHSLFVTRALFVGPRAHYKGPRATDQGQI